MLIVMQVANKANLDGRRSGDVRRLAPSPSWHSRSWPGRRYRGRSSLMKTRQTTPECFHTALESPHPGSSFPPPYQPEKQTTFCCHLPSEFRPNFIRAFLWLRLFIQSFLCRMQLESSEVQIKSRINNNNNYYYYHYCFTATIHVNRH